MARRSYTDHLSNIPLFAGMSNRHLQKIAKACNEVEVQSGRVLVDQGKTGREAFIIVEGSAVVRRNGRKITTLGPGDYFGELALLDHGPRTATVEAETPMRVLVIGSREFGGIIDEVPGLGHKLLSGLAARVRELDNRAFQ